MEESTYQIAEKISKLYQEAYGVYLHWLKMCAAEKYQKMWEDESKK